MEMNMESKTLSLEEVVERIAESLRHSEGDLVAEVYNEVIGGNLTYMGDSYFNGDG
jgi:hypothetical protein